MRVFLGTRDLVNYNHMRLGFLSENVSPWHSIGPCCWRRRDLSKILLLSRRWNAFGLTKCSILFTLQPIAHIFILVLTVAILAQDLIAQPKAMVGWSNRSRAQSESKMDVRRVIRERRLQEAAEEIRRNSNSDQQGTSIPRSSRLHSARSSMPSLSQYGDAESYQIGEPEETAEWYEHDETGNQTHFAILQKL